MKVEDQIHPLQSLEGELAHPGLQQVSRLQEPREVMKYELGIAFGAEADDGQPGRLSLGAHDGQVHADEGVEERRLADVGRARQRHMARPCHVRARTASRAGRTASAGSLQP
jgi:hypothetical protein